jgi:hypothetical protein
MQISLADHNAVVGGLAVESNLRLQQIEALQADLKAARDTIRAMDKAGQELGDAFVSTEGKHAGQLELIRLVAIGTLQDPVPSDDSGWTTALECVHQLAVDFRKKVGELEMVLAAQATKCCKGGKCCKK